MISLFLAMALLSQSPNPSLNPDSIIAQIGVDQNLNAKLDPAIPLRDELGRRVKLGDYFGKNPVILTPVYYACPMLCTELLNGLVKALRVMPLTAGKDFAIVTFSIDPNEGPVLAASKKEHYVRDYGRSQASAGWHFLTGTPDAIQKLTHEIGFRYTFDRNTNQWAHASTIVVLTPDGRISQYWNGIEYDPGDLKLSLVQASDGKIGSVVDHVLLYCYQYDPVTGKYSLMIMRIIRTCGILTVLGILTFILTTRKQRNITEAKHCSPWASAPGVRRMRQSPRAEAHGLQRPSSHSLR